MQEWFRTNTSLIFVAKFVRTFCYGFMGVFFPVYLTQLGLSAKGLGVAVTLILFFSAFLTYLIRRPAQTYGIRTVLLGLSALTLVSGLLFLFFRDPFIVIVAAMIGNLAVGAGETGPFLSLEQVAISREVSRPRMTLIFSLYNLVGYVSGAAGAAMLGKVAVHPGFFFILFAGSGVLQMVLYHQVGAEKARPGSRVALPSDSLIKKIAALFALDSFAGGFVIQTLLVYWFQTRFQLQPGALGWIFFGAQMCSGLSFLIASPLSRKLGLVNTMVFSHLVSNFLLIGLAWASSVTVAVGLLLARHLLSQIDVPTRQAFLMLAVEDHERENAATITNMSRTFAQAVSPSLAGWIIQALSLSAPIILGGGLKIVYDLSLYKLVKNHSVKP